jgi:hypothetical protein
VNVVLQMPFGGLCVAVEGELPKHRRGRQWRGGSEKATTRELGLRQD